MPRLSNADLARVRDFNEEISTLRLDSASSMLEEHLRGFNELLEGEIALAYSGFPADDGCRLDFLHADGLDDVRLRALREQVSRWLSRSSGRWALFDPMRPEPFQRNRAMDIGTLAHLVENGQSRMMDLAKLYADPSLRRRALEALRSAEPLLRYAGVWRHYQLRVLACDGEALLAWVGILQSDPPTIQQRLRLAAVVPALQRRLVVEQQLGRQRLNYAVMEAALEQIGAAALLVVGRKVDGLNASGRRAVDADRELLRGRDSRGRFKRVKLEARGWPDAELWIEQNLLSPADVNAAAKRYRLTPREAQILERLTTGATNRAIAIGLGCAERTVEVHVSRVLRKASCRSRAELIARVGSGRETRA